MFKSDYYLSLPWNVHASDGKSGIINAEKDGQDSDTTFDLYLLNCLWQKSVISYDYIERGGKQTGLSICDQSNYQNLCSGHYLSVIS